MHFAYRLGKVILLWLWKPITLAHVFGVPTQFHVTTVVFPIGFLFVWGWVDRGLVLGVLTLVLSGILLISVLLHELAHALTARSFGIRAKRIVLIPIGGVVQLKEAPNALQEFWIAAAGPATNLLLAAVFHFVALAFDEPFPPWRRQPAYVFLETTAIVNLSLGIYNLVPCYPLDGGRMLRSCIFWVIRKVFSLDSGKAEHKSAQITLRYVAWPIVAGLMIFLSLHPEDWILLVWFPLFLVFGEIEYWLLRDEVCERLPHIHHQTQKALTI